MCRQNLSQIIPAKNLKNAEFAGLGGKTLKIFPLYSWMWNSMATFFLKKGGG